MSTPTCREILTDLWADADEVVRRHLSDQEKLHQAYQLASRVERVLALHQPEEHSCSCCEPACRECEPCSWPCKTVRLLNGEKP